MSNTGTFEWAKHTDNCLLGCENDCRYCYARYNAVVRWKRRTERDWASPKILSNIHKPRGKRSGVTMFPTTHDITPRFLDPCLEVIAKHMAAGNKLLIVSKPSVYCIDAIINDFKEHKDKILFRFTIGAPNNGVLSHWEPGAPVLGERIRSLKLAWENGWQTSVSAEPLLMPDVVSARGLVDMLSPYVTHSIWIGMLNKSSQRVKCDGELDKNMLTMVLNGQNRENIQAIYDALKDNPLVRWKDSYRDMLGLDKACGPELE